MNTCMCTHTLSLFPSFPQNPLTRNFVSLVSPLWFDSDWQSYGQSTYNDILNLLSTPGSFNAKPTLLLKLFLFGGIEKVKVFLVQDYNAERQFFVLVQVGHGWHWDGWRERPLCVLVFNAIL